MITRYNVYLGDRQGKRINESSNGDYVRYVDYKHEVDLLREDFDAYKACSISFQINYEEETFGLSKEIEALQEVVAIKQNTISKLRDEVKMLQGDVSDYQYIINKLTRKR